MALKKKGASPKNGNVHPDDEPKLPVPVRKAKGPPPEAEPEPPRVRRGSTHRRTKETDVAVLLELDGTGRAQVESGVPFLDHMLDAFARHSGIDLKVVARGDVEVDPHHTVEDVALCLGRALLEALGERRGIQRFGEATIPFDETLVRAAVDLSGRPAFVYRVVIPAGRVGSFDVELAEVFFQALASEARMNLHLVLEYGTNRHHIIEACFKALARAVGRAVAPDERRRFEVPSTKGRLD